MYNVTNPSLIDAAFTKPPQGYTPIARVLRAVLADKRATLNSTEHRKKLLVVIATDGEPTDDAGNMDKSTLRYILDHERRPAKSVHVSFVACTDDDMTMRYLNEWDRDVDLLDVVDDYYSERKEVLKAQGAAFPFSRGDWVCKILLGSIDPEVDALDEVPGRRPPVRDSEDCCIIL